jgi:FkbM family methyltransferase
VLDFIARKIAASRAWRYRLGKLSNHPSFQPIYDILSERVAAALRALHAAGFDPETVIDVGAHSGEWTKLVLPIFPAARFVMIEAQPEKEPILRQVQALAPARIDYAIALLGAESRASADFFLADLGSSLYVENTAVVPRRVDLPMLTLDAALARHGVAGTILLKLDVQGAELDVLAGAADTLARTQAILLEASLVEYNRGAPRIAEVIARLKELDFVLYDICDLRRIGAVLAQTDLLFVRRGSALESHAKAVIAHYGI